MMSRRITVLVFLFTLLASCTPGAKLGGGPLPVTSPIPTSPTPTSTTPPPPPTQTTAPLTFSFVMPTTAAMKARRPMLASANTQSLAIFIYAAGSQPAAIPTATVNVGANASGCTVNSGAGQITCTVTVTAPLGNQELEIVAMSGPNGTGSVLSSVTQAVTVAAGAAPISLTLNGTPALIKLSLETPVLALGTGGTSVLDVDAYDASGALIVAPGTFASPLTISSTSTDVALSSTTASGPGTKITLTYNGSSTASPTVQLNATGGGIASNRAIGATLLLEPNQSMAILSWNNGNLGFATMALTSTTTAPLQAYSLAGNPLGSDLIGGGGFAVLPGGGYAIAFTPGGLSCTLVIFPAGSAVGTQAATYGDQGSCALAAEPNGDILASDNTHSEELTEYSVSGTTVTATGRTIALTGAQVPGSLLLPGHIAVNATGAIAVTGSHTGTHYVLTYAAGASGATAPTATATPGTNSFAGLAIASNGAVDVLTSNALSAYQLYEYSSGLGSNTVVTVTAPAGSFITTHGVAIDTAGESLVLYTSFSSATNSVNIDVWEPGVTSAPARTVAVLANVGTQGILAGPIVVPSPAPPTGNTPVSGDMLGYVSGRTWTYLVTPGFDTPYYIGVYADPNLVNGNVRLVGYESSSASSLFTSGTKIGSVDLTQLNGSYLAAAFASASSGTNGISGAVPGTPLLVPSSLAIGQTWNPLQNASLASLAGVTATAQVMSTGSVPGIGACPSGSGTSGATVQYSVTVGTTAPSFISYVPGCGITAMQMNGVGNNIVLQSVGSMPSLGQQDVPQGQPPIVAALHRLWQATLHVHPPSN